MTNAAERQVLRQLREMLEVFEATAMDPGASADIALSNAWEEVYQLANNHFARTRT